MDAPTGDSTDGDTESRPEAGQAPAHGEAEGGETENGSTPTDQANGDSLGRSRADRQHRRRDVLGDAECVEEHTEQGAEPDQSEVDDHRVYPDPQHTCEEAHPIGRLCAFGPGQDLAGNPLADEVECPGHP